MHKFCTWIKCNQGIGFILTVFFGALLIYLELSPWVHRKLRDGFTLGFFPVLAVVLCLFLSIILIFDQYRNETTSALKSITFISFISSFLAVIVCWLYFELMKKIGFLIISPIFLLFFIYALGLKSWRKCIASAAIMTVIVYLIFSILGIELPQGIIPFTLSLGSGR